MKMTSLVARNAIVVLPYELDNFIRTDNDINKFQVVSIKSLYSAIFLCNSGSIF